MRYACSLAICPLWRSRRNDRAGSRRMKTCSAGTLCPEPRAVNGVQKLQQIRVHLICMSGSQSVRKTRIVEFFCALDEFGRLSSRVVDRHDLVIFPVHDQGRDVELAEVITEIGLRECSDRVVDILQTALHAPEPELIQEP